MNPEIITAVEFGFRCAEKGLNLDATFRELAKIHAAPLGDCPTCDGYVINATEAPFCPSCARERATKAAND